jgi:NAD dependent epimerase/dehydratase family enzyme
MKTGTVKSRRVIPGRLTASGFQFRFAKLEDALRDIERGVA